MTVGQLVWKFRPFNQITQNMILNNQVFFSCPLDYNDPFEGYICDAKMTDLNRSESYLLCTGKNGITDTPECQLMWGHYADSHKGVAIQYQLPMAYTEVKYTVPESPPKTPLDTYTHKPIAWEYEQELRYFYTSSDIHMLKKLIDIRELIKKGSVSNPLNLPTEILMNSKANEYAIEYGLPVSDIQKHINFIINHVENIEYVYKNPDLKDYIIGVLFTFSHSIIKSVILGCMASREAIRIISNIRTHNQFELAFTKIESDTMSLSYHCYKA